MTHFTILNLRPFDQENTTYVGVYNDNDTVDPNGIIQKIDDNKIMEAGFEFSLHNEYNKLKSRYSHISVLGFEDHNSLQEYMDKIADTKKKPIVLKLYRETEEYLVFNNDITYGKKNESKDSESFHNDYPLTETPFNLLNGIVNVLENSSNDNNSLLDHFSNFLTGVVGPVDNTMEEPEKSVNKESSTEKSEKETMPNHNKSFNDHNDDYHMVNGIFKDFPVSSNNAIQDFLQDLVNGASNNNDKTAEHLNNPFDPKDFLSNNTDSQKSKNVGYDTIKNYFDKIEEVEEEFAKKQEELEQEKKLALENVKNEFFKNI